MYWVAPSSAGFPPDGTGGMYCVAPSSAGAATGGRYCVAPSSAEGSGADGGVPGACPWCCAPVCPN